MTAPLGPIVTGWQLEVGTQQTIETWLATYLSALDRAVFSSETAVIPRPPAPALQLPTNSGQDSGNPTSIHGGVDVLTSSFDQMPETIVRVEPDEEPVYFGSGDYTASYEVTISCLVYGQSETLARMYASLYGAAIMALILQNGDLGGIATRTRLSKVPSTGFVDAADSDDAQLVQSDVSFLVYVDSSVNDLAGISEPVTGDTLTNPDPSQLPPDWPSAAVVNLAFAYVQASADASSASFDGLVPSNGQVPSDTLIPEGSNIVTQVNA